VSVAVQTGFCKDRVVFLKADGNRQVGKQTQRSTVVCGYMHHTAVLHVLATTTFSVQRLATCFGPRKQESKNCHCHPRRSAPCCHWLAWGAPSCGLYPALPIPIPNLDSPAFTPALTFTAQPHTQITCDTATAPPGSHGHHSDCAHSPLAIVASPFAIRHSQLDARPLVQPAIPWPPRPQSLPSPPRLRPRAVPVSRANTSNLDATSPTKSQPLHSTTTLQDTVSSQSSPDPLSRAVPFTSHFRIRPPTSQHLQNDRCWPCLVCSNIAI
jgi:hypothetical protein